MYEQEEISLLDIQLFFTIVSIISFVISIILIQNQKLKTEKQPTLFSDKQIDNLANFNRLLILIITLIFLGVNYKLYNIAVLKGEDLKNPSLQIVASSLVVIAAIIALYVGFNADEEDDILVDIENPLL